MKAAVIGSPVSHSLSPAIFEFISLQQGTPIDYAKREVRPEALEEFLKGSLAQEDFVGCNVTLPLKELVFKALPDVSEAAKATGAVNVIHFKNGSSIGHNTDVIGIEKTFQRAGFELKGKTCLLWGAGGSAKACAFVLGQAEASTVYIFNRGERGHELAQHYKELFPKTCFKALSALEEIQKVELDLMINATSLGMQGQAPGLAYFSQMSALRFTPGALAFDLIYIPETTDFLKAAAAAGLRVVGGLGMLIDQALATWEIWIGALENEQKLHAELALVLKGILHLRYHPAPVFLTGFMGVGKTTVAQSLARLTQREFLDSDTIIEAKAKLSISQIFASAGEGEFRKLESLAVKEASEKQHAVISLGGGALNLPHNFETVQGRGTLVYLEADPETLHQRISEQGLKRPLLEGLSPVEKAQKISTLLNERKSVYEKAKLIISTKELSAEKVCFAILKKIGELS